MPPENETAVQNVESTELSAEPTLEDLKSRLESSEVANKKLENDLRSERGQRTRDQAINELAEDVGGIKAQLTAIANRTASGETESLPADFAEIDRKKAVTAESANWQNSYDEAEHSLAEALMDSEDNVLVDKETISKLSASWQEAQKSQDLHGLYRIVNQAGKEAKLATEQKAKADLTQVEENAKAAKKVSDTKHGNHDLAIPTPSGVGSGVKSRAQIESETDVKNISKEDYEAYVAGG